MSSVKVIPDTNVIIAASIIQNISEINEEIKHKFYDESIQLFSLFKHSNERKGIALPKVKKESFGVLARAVKDVFIAKKNIVDIHTKTLFYNNASSIIFSSDHKRQALLARLANIKIKEEDVRQCLQDVIEMTKELRALYYDKYKNKKGRIKESQIRSKNIKTEPKWRPEQKDEVFYTQSGQVARESKQLEKFMKKYPNAPDQRVLSEAIAVKNHLISNGEDIIILIASRDTGFFSPYYYYGGKSDVVTQKIHEKFQIRCDYPRDIFKMAGGVL